MRGIGTVAGGLLALLALAGEARAQANNERTGINAAGQTQVLCGTTSTLALAANSQRNFLAAQSAADTPIYLTFNAPSTGGVGMILPVSGSVLFMDTKVAVGAMYCRHGSTGTKVLFVNEGIK